MSKKKLEANEPIYSDYFSREEDNDEIEVDINLDNSRPQSDLNQNAK